MAKVYRRWDWKEVDMWGLAVGQNARPAALALQAVLEQQGRQSELLDFDGIKPLHQAISAHAEAGHGVVAVGGDGTINLVADALLAARVSQPPRLGVLPAGTGCDFARLFAFTKDPAEAAARLVSGSAYPLDVGLISGAFGTRSVVNVAEAGLGAAALQMANRLPRWVGPIKYQLSFPMVLPTFKESHIQLKTDRRQWEGRASLVAIANAEYFGGGLQVAPKASVVDGKFNVIVAEGGKWGTLNLFQKMKRGVHLKDPRIHHFVTSTFELECASQWPVETDGEYLGTGSVTGKVLPAALMLQV